jgi:hypothetical protein
VQSIVIASIRQGCEEALDGQASFQMTHLINLLSNIMSKPLFHNPLQHTEAIKSARSPASLRYRKVSRAAAAMALILHFLYKSSPEVIDHNHPSIESRKHIYGNAFSRDPDNFKNYNDLLSGVNFNIPLPHNLNIVFMGDSLMRYQYLDMAYFLSHNGTWVSPEDTPNMLMENTHSDWNSFYNFTNTNLRPYESCDCFRNQKKGREQNHELTTENRYFFDTERNNRVTFLLKFGDKPFKTSWTVPEIHQTHELVTNDNDVAIINKWNWVDTVKHFVCAMEPTPSAFIFNSGLWRDNDLSKLDVQIQILSALRACGITSIYKTTTASKDGEETHPDKNRKQLCSLADMCQNISWTALVPPEKYSDRLHFRPPIYSMLNIHLLSYLASSEIDFSL